MLGRWVLTWNSSEGGTVAVDRMTFGGGNDNSSRLCVIVSMICCVSSWNCGPLMEREQSKDAEQRKGYSPNSTSASSITTHSICCFAIQSFSTPFEMALEVPNNTST